MLHHPSPKDPSGDPSATPLAVLIKEVTHRESGSARFVPPNVQTALDRLELLEGRGHQYVTEVEALPLLRILREYRDTIRDIERRQFAPLRDLQRYQECLFAFLNSDRSLTDFNSFCLKAALPPGMITLQTELFCRNAARFVGELHYSMKTGSLHTHLALFLECVSTTHITDPPTAERLLDILAQLYVRNTLQDSSLILKIVQQGYASTPCVLRAVESLISCSTIDNYEDRDNFLLLGQRVADILAAKAHHIHMLRSHPIVELGFLKQTIQNLSRAPSTQQSHALLCRLCHSIPEYFVYIDGQQLRQLIASLHVSVSHTLTFAEAPMARELASAAKEILQQPWEREISRLWSLCAFPDPTDFDLLNVSAQVLGAALVSDENLMELKEKVYTLALKRDRETTQQLEHIGRLLGLLLERESKNPRSSTHARNAVELLSESSVAAKVALPALMRLVGVSGVALGRWGFLPFPWRTSQHPDRRVRSKARGILLSMQDYVGPFGLRRIEEK